MYGRRFLPGFVMVMLASSSALHAQNRIAWTENLAAARQTAEQQQRLLLLHFWSDSCPPCMRLERTVFNRPEVVRAVMANYVPVKINATNAPQLAAQFKVKRWPTDIIATVDGKEIYRGVSQSDPNRYIAVLDQVSANTRVGFPVQGPASTPIARTPTRSVDPHNSSFPIPDPRLDANVTNGALATDRNQPPANANRPAVQPSYVTNQYAQQTVPQLPASADMAPAYGSQFVPPGNGPALNSASSSPVGPTENGPMMRNEPPRGNSLNAGARSYGAQTPPASTAQATGPAPNRQAPPQSARQETAPANPPIGLEGYCPVTLAENEQWVKGDARWGAIHEGRTYLFAGPEQQQRFLANFEKYAPVLSGCDPVQFVQTGKLVDGKRAHGVFYRDQIYLFVDEASLQQFWTAPERYALAALAARQQQRAGQTTRR